MLEELKQLLGKVLPDKDLSEITEQTRLVEDLKFDSLSMMMLAMEIEDAYHFRFAEFVSFETVGDVVGYLESRV
ncbi:MAG: acyl carrier protein [Clostridia bacterium]|nr:acyl carrier protein [Clostridia bacterium]